MKRWSFGLIGIGCTFAAAAAAVEASRPPQPPAAAVPVPTVRPGSFAASSAPFARRLTAEQREEWRFLKQAAAAGRFERDAAKLALAKSGDPNLRTLAAALADHHADSLPALQLMLHARNMAPPMLSNGQRRALNRLGRLHGAKFDREWMEFVALRSQRESLQAFEKASTGAADPQLRSWVDRTLPTLRYQLASAERIVKGGTKFARLAPLIPPGTFKAPVAPAAAMPEANPGEGDMVPAVPGSVAAKLTAPSSR